ncbi:MAG: hypothetical protein OXG71_03140 [Rhodospirillales bacterium]|nr:hypothetical protein [Rhodospirillales bacterium]
MATIDVHTTVQDLEAAGADPKLAAAIAQGIARAAPARGGSSGINILATATGLGFMLITVVFGWFMIEASQQRADLRAGIEANRDRIDAVETRLSGDIARLSERISGLETRVSERLTRIETLLEERLPERR